MVTVPAPVGGWNARDAVSAMAATDAIELVNMFPRPDKVVSRGGSTVTVTPASSDPVETIIEWRGATSRQMFYAAGAKVYKVGTGAVLAALSSARFQWTTISTGVKTYIVLANGLNDVAEYDGTTWTVPTIYGVTSSKLVHVNNYRGRLFFVEKDSLRAWYLSAGAIAGSAFKLDFTRDAKRGGHLVAMGTWAQDSGDGGTDDLAVFVTSEGEVIIYQGSDPSSPTSWSCVGVFQTGRPVGRRCMLRYGADLCLILEDGFFPISSLLQNSVVSPSLALSDKIRNAFATAAAKFGETDGWEAIYHPKGQKVMVNVPNEDGGFDQYVMNSITKAWCKWTNINATTLGVYDGKVYAGQVDGSILELDYGYDDIGGDPIPVTARQAFTDMQVPGAMKYLTMFRPRMGVSGSVTVQAALEFDYSYGVNPSGGITISGGSTLWDAGLWDVSSWNEGDSVIAPWFTFGGMGRTVSAHLVANSNSGLSWYDTDYLLEAGGVL